MRDWRARPDAFETRKLGGLDLRQSDRVHGLTKDGGVIILASCGLAAQIFFPVCLKKCIESMIIDYWILLVAKSYFAGGPTTTGGIALRTNLTRVASAAACMN